MRLCMLFVVWDLIQYNLSTQQQVFGRILLGDFAFTC